MILWDMLYKRVINLLCMRQGSGKWYAPSPIPEQKECKCQFPHLIIRVRLMLFEMSSPTPIVSSSDLLLAQMCKD